jgi:hypothetical protein
MFRFPSSSVNFGSPPCTSPFGSMSATITRLPRLILSSISLAKLALARFQNAKRKRKKANPRPFVGDFARAGRFDVKADGFAQRAVFKRHRFGCSILPTNKRLLFSAKIYKAVQSPRQKQHRNFVGAGLNGDFFGQILFLISAISFSRSAT